MEYVGQKYAVSETSTVFTYGKLHKWETNMVVQAETKSVSLELEDHGKEDLEFVLRCNLIGCIN